MTDPSHLPVARLAGLQQESLAIRTALPRSQYQEHCEPIYTTSSFVFENAAQAAARFGNEDPGSCTSGLVTQLLPRSRNASR